MEIRVRNAAKRSRYKRTNFDQATLVILHVPLTANNKYGGITVLFSVIYQTARIYIYQTARGSRVKNGNNEETDEKSAWVSLISDGATRVDYYQPAGLEVRR